MIFKMKIKNKYLKLPIKKGEDLKKLEIEVNGVKEFEFKIPSGYDRVDFYAYIDVEKYINKEFMFTGDFHEEWFGRITGSERAEYNQNSEDRPLLHFTAYTGWINDPNGLVYQDGTYHLYFQYNPFNTLWENMSWGHAVSRDLLHWTQLDTALWPDRYGTIYSGCGIVNNKKMLGLDEKALVFFYTAAGSENDWSRDVMYTQRMAYSTDGGKTLIKCEKGGIDTISSVNRDPYVFWHEESKAYILVLWIENNDFGIFRSANLESWELSQRITLEKGFECPGLFRVRNDNGEYRWIFWTAAGYYFVGDFDGYRFMDESGRKTAYANNLPYAAQIFSNTAERVISIPWLKTNNEGRNYRSMMGIPRELKLTEGQKLRHIPIAELDGNKIEIYSAHKNSVNFDIDEDIPFEVTAEFSYNTKECILSMQGVKIEIHNIGMRINGENITADERIYNISVIADKFITEISANDHTIYYPVETDISNFTGEICAKSDSELDFTVYSYRNIFK